MATKAAPQPESVTKVIRVTLSPDAWRRLRVQAAEADLSMTRYLGSVLEVAAGKGGK